MVNTRKKFPRGILDQVISNSSATAPAQRAPGPSFKPQASSPKLIKVQATSFKPQATSFKLQATSFKLHDS